MVILDIVYKYIIFFSWVKNILENTGIIICSSPFENVKAACFWWVKIKKPALFIELVFLFSKFVILTHLN